MSRAVFITRVGGPESLEIRERVVREPGDHEILIQVKAIGVNFADVMARRGLYPGAPRRPFIPGYEIAGEVVAVGNRVEGWRPGERAMALTHFGGYAEHVCVPAEHAFSISSTMPWVDAAAIPLNFLTAYHALFHTGVVREGARVLIHAAAGGVGLAAVQLARHAGAVVFGTVGSEAKVQFLEEFGVPYAINYRERDFARQVKQITQGEGVDIILDSVGGGQLRKDLRLLRANGRLVSLGVASLLGKSKPKLLLELLRIPRVHLLKLLQNSQGIMGVNFNQLLGFTEMLREAMETILRLYAEGVVKPIIGREFPWEDAAEAHRLMESRTNIGKIVLWVEPGETTGRSRRVGP